MERPPDEAVERGMPGDGVMKRTITTETLAAALDHMTVAVALTDNRGRVLFTNTVAQHLMAGCDGLQLHNGVLDAGSAQGAPRCCKPFIERRRGGPPARSCFPVARVRPFTRLVVPLTSAATNASHPIVGVFVSDPEAPAVLKTDRLCALFSLTRAEAKFAERLAAGKSFADATAALAITSHTGRGLVKQLLRKTSTSTQLQAVVKLLSSVANPPRRHQRASPRRT